LEKAAKPAIRFQWLTPAVFLGLFLVTVVIFATTFGTADLSSSGPPIGPFVVVPVIWVITMGGFFACACGIRSRITEDLHSICERESQKYPNISFHLKEEQYYVHNMHSSSHGGGYRTNYYIEILIASQMTPSFQNAPAISPSYIQPDVEAVPIVAAEPEISSVASRLDQLEKVKHHLTAKEYEQKRLDILRSL